MKYINYILLLLFSVSILTVNAQKVAEGQSDLAAKISPPAECAPAQIYAKSLINYQHYSKLFIEFQAIPNGQLVILKSKNDGTEIKEYTLKKKVLFKKLKHDHDYEVITKNINCPDRVAIAQISTKIEDMMNTDNIEVSDRLYQTVLEYQGLKTKASLVDFIDNKAGISPYEKIAFLQQFMLNGELLVKDNGIKLPLIDESNARYKGCNCSLVINGSPFISNMYVASNSGGKISMGGAAEWWWDYYSEGPAKWSQVTSDAWKDGTLFSSSTKSRELDHSENDNFYAMISFTLFCYNNTWPYTCPCTKPIDVYYNYISELGSDTKVLSGGGGQKKAFGQAQDIVAVSMVRRNVNLNDPEVQILDSEDFKMEVSCQGGNINNDFWKPLAEVAGSIVQVASGDVSQIPDLVTDLGDLIGTPIYVDHECTNTTTTNTLVNTEVTGPKRIRISSNEEVKVILSSHSKLRTGGKRSWSSQIVASSTFYLGALMRSDIALGSSYSCCSNDEIMWETSAMGNRKADFSNLVLLPQGFMAAPYSQGGWSKPANHNCQELEGWEWLRETQPTPKDVPVMLRSNLVENDVTKNLSADALTISPNPVSNVMELSFASAELKSGQLSIYDMTGRLMKTQPIKTGKTQYIDVSSFAQGTYIVSIIENDTLTIQTKFVKH